MVSQLYLTTEVGELTFLRTVKEFAAHPDARYYHIDDFVVLPEHARVSDDIRASGKHSQYLNFNFYFMLPIGDDSTHNIESKYNCWYGIKMHRQISNRLSPAEKEAEFQSFHQESFAKIKSYPFHKVQYFRRLPNSEDRDLFLEAIPTNTITDQTVVLEPKQDAFDQRSGNKLFWIFGTATIGSLVFLFALIWPRYSVMELQRQQQGRKSSEKDDVIEMFQFLIPKEPHFSTSIILDLNILVFILMVLGGVHFMSPNVSEVMEWGANRRYETTNGEWWRLLSSMFVHGGVVHLVFNIFGLVVAGTYLEAVIGAKKYALIYVLSGLAGSIASIAWHSHTASVGASGAIFGLFGAILSFTMSNRLPKEARKMLLLIFGPYVLINLLYGLTGGIDNAAHIGGLLCGLIIGFIIQRYVIDEQEE